MSGLKVYEIANSIMASIVDEGPGVISWIKNVAGRKADCGKCYLYAEPGFCARDDGLQEFSYDAMKTLAIKNRDYFHYDPSGNHRVKGVIPKEELRKIFEDGKRMVMEGMAQHKKVFKGVKVKFRDFDKPVSDGSELDHMPQYMLRSALIPEVINCRRYAKSPEFKG